MDMGVLYTRSGKKYSSLAFVLAIVAIAVTIASQFFGGDLLVVYGPLWVAVAALGLHGGGAKTIIGHSSLLFLLAYVMFGASCSLLFLLTGESGYVSNIFLCLTKIVLMYFVGVSISSLSMSDARLKWLAYAYIISAFVFAVWVQVTYMPTLSSWLASKEYLFGQKNSFGQIVGVAVVLCLVLPKRNFRARMLMLCSGVYMFAMLAGAQCRTTMIGCALVAAAYLFIKKKIRILFACFAVLMVLLLVSPQVQSVAAHAFLLDKYDGTSLNGMSSGRLDLWGNALSIIEQNALFGVGNFYVDNFYLNVLANLGLVVGGFLVFLILLRFLLNLKLMTSLVHERSVAIENRNSVVKVLCGLLAVFYLVESALEGLPPIGPGACSFVFWILCGYIDEAEAHKVSYVGMKRSLGAMVHESN